jgi:hypothetical protein
MRSTFHPFQYFTLGHQERSRLFSLNFRNEPQLSTSSLTFIPSLSRSKGLSGYFAPSKFFAPGPKLSEVFSFIQKTPLAHSLPFHRVWSFAAFPVDLIRRLGVRLLHIPRSALLHSSEHSILVGFIARPPHTKSSLQSSAQVSLDLENLDAELYSSSDKIVAKVMQDLCSSSVLSGLSLEDSSVGSASKVKGDPLCETFMMIPKLSDTRAVKTNSEELKIAMNFRIPRMTIVDRSDRTEKTEPSSFFKNTESFLPQISRSFSEPDSSQLSSGVNRKLDPPQCSIGDFEWNSATLRSFDEIVYISFDPDALTLTLRHWVDAHTQSSSSTPVKPLVSSLVILSIESLLDGFYKYATVTRNIVCRACTMSSNSSDPPLISFDECAAVTHSGLPPPRCVACNASLDLSFLAPDLALKDVPRILKSDLIQQELLGEGAAGQVKRVFFCFWLHRPYFKTLLFRYFEDLGRCLNMSLSSAIPLNPVFSGRSLTLTLLRRSLPPLRSRLSTLRFNRRGPAHRSLRLRMRLLLPLYHLSALPRPCHFRTKFA